MASLPLIFSSLVEPLEQKVEGNHDIRKLNAEKIKGRLAMMTKSFCKYFELDYPEELVDMIAEVEEKLAAKEEKAEGVVLEDEVTSSEEKMEDVSVIENVETTEEVEQNTENVENAETVECDTENVENTEEVIDTEDSVEGAVNLEETVSEDENTIDEVSLEESDAHTEDGVNADTPSYEGENPNDEGSF